MSEEEIKKIEARGYARGYRAGRAKQERHDQQADAYTADKIFLDSAFMAALPACIAADAWKRGDKAISTITDRTQLAWDFAIESLRKRRYP